MIEPNPYQSPVSLAEPPESDVFYTQRLAALRYVISVEVRKGALNRRPSMLRFGVPLAIGSPLHVDTFPIG